MTKHVSAEMPQTQKTFVALLTAIRFPLHLLNVMEGDQMLFQGLWVLVLFITELAIVVPLFHVDVHVPFQVTLLKEPFVADLAFELPVLDIRVLLHMILIRGYSRQHFRAVLTFVNFRSIWIDANSEFFFVPLFMLLQIFQKMEALATKGTQKPVFVVKHLLMVT